MSVRKALRDHGKLQIAVITHVVVDGVILDAVRIKALRFAVRVEREGYRAGHRHRSGKRNGSVRADGDRRIMDVADIEFYFVAHIQTSI
jgi:hypothetical protein